MLIWRIVETFPGNGKFPRKDDLFGSALCGAPRPCLDPPCVASRSFQYYLRTTATVFAPVSKRHLHLPYKYYKKTAMGQKGSAHNPQLVSYKDN